ncbi:similar to Saccharomyces cerevisiae YHR163W SOL3 6- phosphogluconolactonase, catalyzes the second step of the pentose phosphate pathway [Maudiozyma barnettii]|uniref:6-phosphogluconolactonase-like protein n=1 Tax=Maudiozyma barnettii TaxID=61262 RepID=A0A8H2VGN4_9SACH|nr:6-phosphogluconolactonase SOL3 [Kazachstania barnettii]CAB4254878.1 similar to Saccharomyces cerevisiae YHR163W SOL3 6- phosphogluconolactonase, catalyzes the second step of the pentose phosphate pathway [Kazachstania barnettii]CAD1783117.1 similar to Saccharomyces cerevisiae YHR163W SOL3 6- phosphogluconolactonase, catalyzes the second step of the pentose phosphate pathway [Kazachstania barnettii]
MVSVHKYSIEENLPHKLGEYILQKQEDSLKNSQVFNVAISGGSLIDVLEKGLVDDPTIAPKIKWDKWNVYFVDERIVPLDHRDSNYCAFKDAVLDKLSVLPRVYPIDDSLVDAGSAAYEKIASEYEELLPKKLDLLLLGCGPDGHTCSLFPGDHHRYLIEETTKQVMWCHDSPKPPSDRITITLPVMEGAGAICFVTMGTSKQDAMHHIFDLKDTSMPCAVVNEHFDAKVSWFVDDLAFETVTTNL